METTTRDIQRIARMFNLKADDEHLVLKIGDIVKAKDSEINKKKFANDMLWAKNKQYKKQVDNLHNEFAENIGITEHMMVKQSRDVLRKELNKSLEETHRLNETIRRYKERELNDRLMKIVNE